MVLLGSYYSSISVLFILFKPQLRFYYGQELQSGRSSCGQVDTAALAFTSGVSVTAALTFFTEVSVAVARASGVIAFVFTFDISISVELGPFLSFMSPGRSSSCLTSATTVPSMSASSVLNSLFFVD